MSDYATMLRDMMQAVRGHGGCEHLVKDLQGFPAARQLAVYAEGYLLRLSGVLKGAYPALRTLLGDRAFGQLAQGYIDEHPSREFNIDRYPIAFAGYVSSRTGDAFTQDLARLESAVHDVYQRPETPALDDEWASVQSPQALAQTRFSLRIASVLLEFSTPVNAYLSAFRKGERPPVPGPGKSGLLVLRHRHRVQRLELSEAEHTLLALLRDGMTLRDALEDARMQPFARADDFAIQLKEWFARWVVEGVFIKP